MVLLFRNSPGNPRNYSYQILRGSALKPAQQLRVDLYYFARTRGSALKQLWLRRAG